MKTKHILKYFCIGSLLTIAVQAQVFLSGNSYLESFNNLGAGLPDGWSVRTGATEYDLGNMQAFNSSPISWSTLTGGFKNYASVNNPGAAATDSSTIQAGYADRALGIRQSSSFGDPGAAFVVALANTVDCYSFNLRADLQIASNQPRSTLWTFDYRVGDTGDFIPYNAFVDPGTYGSTAIFYSLGSLIDNRDEAVYLRIAARSASSGSGNRDSFAVDNFSLEFTSVPEPAAGWLLTGFGLAGFAGYRWWTGRLTRASGAGTGVMAERKAPA